MLHQCASVMHCSAFYVTPWLENGKSETLMVGFHSLQYPATVPFPKAERRLFSRQDTINNLLIRVSSFTIPRSTTTAAIATAITTATATAASQQTVGGVIYSQLMLLYLLVSFLAFPYMANAKYVMYLTG